MYNRRHNNNIPLYIHNIRQRKQASYRRARRHLVISRVWEVTWVSLAYIGNGLVLAGIVYGWFILP